MSLVDLYSSNPANLSVQISSANFGEGNYPYLGEHAWVVRAHDGFHFTLTFDFVEVEKDQDVIKVFKYQNDGEKKIVDQVDVAREFEVDSNRVLVVFRSDCSVNKKGFRATIRAVGRDNNKATSPATKSYKMVSTEESFENITSEKTTPQNTMTQTATTPKTNHTTAISQIVKKGKTIINIKLTKSYKKITTI